MIKHQKYITKQIRQEKADFLLGKADLEGSIESIEQKFLLTKTI